MKTGKQARLEILSQNLKIFKRILQGLKKTLKKFLKNIHFWRNNFLLREQSIAISIPTAISMII